ncbi:AraC family transcriptional regulator [Parachitinimonas caeni]|nr:AraC family transcriptional regulator [Parachitinimonas caeni]
MVAGCIREIILAWRILIKSSSKKAILTPMTPRVVTSYLQTLLDAAIRCGLDSQVLLSEVGLDRTPPESVPVPVYLALFELAGRMSAHPAFGLAVGAEVKPTTYGVNGILLLACRDLGAALESVLKFECLVHDLGRSQLVRDGHQYVYRWRNDWSAHPAAADVAVSVFAGIKVCADWLAGKPVPAERVCFAHKAPHNVGDYQRLLAAPVEFGAGENRIEFSAEVLAWPIPQANAGLYPMLLQHAETLVARLRPEESDVVVRVRQAILRRLGSGAPQLADVAIDLGTSARTLQRRLQESGQPFQRLLEDTRHELARHYLEQTGLPVAEIGLILGYQEPSAFHHAFRGWQGESPGQYRRRQVR